MKKSNHQKSKVALVVALAVAVTLGTFAAPAEAKSSAKKAKALVGLFSITPGAAGTGTPPVTGSYFRMVQPNGTVVAGPFVPNADSAATDKTYTLLQPGTDGGLLTGKYQPQPDPPFDAAGNGMSTGIVAPPKFFGVSFAAASNKTDPQTTQSTKVPSLKNKGGKLSGDLDAIGVAYGKQYFNQGAPKPDGTKPGATAGPVGTYDAKTRAYTLDWSSVIVGGPFNGFTGIWHLEGTFSKGKK